MGGKLWDRYSADSLEQNEKDAQGRIFISGLGIEDLSTLQVIGESVDTIRQLFRGIIRPEFIEQLETLLEQKQKILPVPAPAGLEWHLGYAGKHSGYQYKLQNNQEGLIILLKSFYSEKDQEGAHMKVELSPKYISARGKEEIGKALSRLANSILEKDWKWSGCAVHLALDVQGWEPGRDFARKFVTRARATQDYQSISEFTFEELSNVAVMYGDNESWLFGKANSLQVAIYRKDREIIVSDKQDHFYRQWDSYTFGLWDKDAPVWRIEIRAHHQVTRELGASQNEEFESWDQVSEYLADIWRYGLTINRLDQTSTYIDPVWQLLREEPKFYHPPVGFYFYRKKKEASGNVHKNYSLIIGNLITVCARMNYDVNQVMRDLKKLSFYDELILIYKRAGQTESDLREKVKEGLLLRRMIGKAA